MPTRTRLEYFDGRRLLVERMPSRKVYDADAERDFEDALRGAPPWAFAFRYFDEEYDVVTVPGQGEVEVNVRVKNRTGVYYIDGQVFGLPQVQEQFPEEKVLIRNMEVGGYSVIRARNGRWFPIYEGDMIIPSNWVD